MPSELFSPVNKSFISSFINEKEAVLLPPYSKNNNEIEKGARREGKDKRSRHGIYKDTTRGRDYH